MKIMITGVPGSGKSTYAKLLTKELGIKSFNDKDFVVDADEIELYGSKVKDVDIVKFEKKARKELKGKEEFILEGLLFPETEIEVDLILILEPNEEELEKRMKEREYSDLKIAENIYCQETNYFYELLTGKIDKEKIHVIKMDKEIKDNMERILKIISL
jgi:adenylate kinase